MRPEFTMLEWYRAQEPYEAVIEDSLTLLRLRCGNGRRENVLISRMRIAIRVPEPSG